ncbi:MAG: PaaI family thioesterase [Acidimicrobiales bacterium]
MSRPRGARYAHLAECFGCGRDSPHGLGLVIDAVEGRSWCRTRFDRGHQGAPGLVHGGLLVTLLDEVMGSLPFDDERVRVTRSMEVRFRLPVAIDRDVEAVATLGTRDGRSVPVRGEVRYLDDADVRVEIVADYVTIDRASR